MRKIIILFCLVFSFMEMTGCKKDSFVAAFEQSADQRMSDTMAYVKETLTSAPNGWIVTTPVYFGGGYGFYMEFDASMQVMMYSDLLDDFASDAYQSQTRIKADMGAALIFDTYNYITELNSPDNNVRDGYGGDVTYIYDHTNGDSIIFLGKRYRQPLSFVKATAAQQSTYKSGKFLTAMDGFRNFFATNSNAYISLDNGTKISIEPNFSNNLNAGKRITLTALDKDDNISSGVAKFAFTADQMAILGNGVNIAGLQFVKIAWKDASTLAIYTSNGTEYIINNSPVPILPLYMLMGVKYSSLYGEYKTIFPGTSTDGATLLNSYYDNLAHIPRYAPFNYGNLRFSWNLANNRMTLTSFHNQSGIWPVNGGTGWSTSIVYNYTMDNHGNYTFTKQSNASGGYAAPIMTTLDNFFLTNIVNLDYYIDPSTNAVYGKMASVTNPDIVMTFQLTQ